MSGMNMKTAVNGLELHYTDTGEKNLLPLILIHGFPFNLEMWRPQLDALNGKARLIAYDLRGHGQSQCGDGQSPLEFFVDDLLGLMDHLGIAKAALCGLSMGGYIALRAVERSPERVSALILADTRSEADGNPAKIKRAAAMKTLKTSGVSTYADESIKGLLRPNSKPEFIERVKALIGSNTPLGIGEGLLALAGRTDTTASLSAIAVPALVLVGAQDGLTPPADALALSNRIPGAQLEIIPDAGHVSNLENPQAFNKSLIAFLAKLN